MSGTAAIVWVLLGGCLVLVVGILAWAQVQIIRIQTGEPSRRK